MVKCTGARATLTFTHSGHPWEDSDDPGHVWMVQEEENSWSLNIRVLWLRSLEREALGGQRWCVRWLRDGSWWRVAWDLRRLQMLGRGMQARISVRAQSCVTIKTFCWALAASRWDTEIILSSLGLQLKHKMFQNLKNYFNDTKVTAKYP